MAFDPNKKNTNNFQSMPSYTNPYSPPPAPQKKGSGAGIKVAVFAIIAILLVVGGIGMSFYLSAMKNASENSTNIDGESLNNGSVVEIEIFN